MKGINIDNNEDKTKTSITNQLSDLANSYMIIRK